MEDRPETIRGDKSEASGFDEEAKLDRPGFLSELVAFLRHNKKWWLSPIIVILLMVGVIIVLSSTAAAPFIYTLF